MKLEAKSVGKKFGKNWIFRECNFVFENEAVVITGRNGAGKSTLLQILSGYLSPTKGHVLLNNKEIMEEGSDAIAYIGPYTEIIEEFTLREFLRFHGRFRKSKLEIAEIAEKASLPLDKCIGDFSTGMKQRIKLTTAFYFNNDILFLDEPTANLDAEGFRWWKACMEATSSTSIFVASNDSREIAVCKQQIDL